MRYEFDETKVDDVIRAAYDLSVPQGAFDSFGGLVSEHECLRADAAIDAVMTGKIVSTHTRGKHE